nr:helix-turn-helix transcriptional regulator [uncultured Acetatifactor sp.]
MNVHLKLCQLLKARNWTEYRLAKKCGLSESTLANVFRRNTTPSIPTLEALCKGFGITLSQFFAEDEMVELTPELKELFDVWVRLTPRQKAAVYNLISAFEEDCI